MTMLCFIYAFWARFIKVIQDPNILHCTIMALLVVQVVSLCAIPFIR